MLKKHLGLGIFSLILGGWGLSLVYGLKTEHDWLNPLTYLWIILQAHLYTGLFISGHDAMHRTASPIAWVNSAIGWISATLFAFNYFPKLLKNHHKHHRYVATGQDPDYHDGGFWRWYGSFLSHYLSVWQFIAMAVCFNILIELFRVENVVLWWMLPAILSTFQLFYFGTYLPHRNPPDNPHKARTLSKNHFWAFVSCYFFGYHYEHHDSPATPWWQLYTLK